MILLSGPSSEVIVRPMQTMCSKALASSRKLFKGTCAARRLMPNTLGSSQTCPPLAVESGIVFYKSRGLAVYARSAFRTAPQQRALFEHRKIADQYMLFISSLCAESDSSLAVATHSTLVNATQVCTGSESRPDSKHHKSANAVLMFGPGVHLSLIHISEPTRPY